MTGQAQPSYVSGTSDRPLIYVTVGGVLANAAAQWPERTALVSRHQNIRYTFRELDRAVDRVAAGLVDQGLAPGDRVGLWSPNNAEWVLVMFAAARAGLILVNVNPAFQERELEFVLRQVGCRALVTAPGFKTTDYLAILGKLVPELATSRPGGLASARLPELRLIVQLGGGAAPGVLPFAALAAESWTPPTPDPDHAYNIQFTSGTTGLPKGATLSHFNLVNNGYFAGECLRLAPDDGSCIPVPMYHCFGMVLGVLAAVTHGARSVFPAESFDPLATLEAVAAERCTALLGVPTMFIAELDHPRFAEFDLTSLRTGIMAGAPCPTAVMRRVVDDMHMREVTIAYGMTETSPVSFQSTPDDPIERRVTSVGRVHPHVEVKLVDRDGRVVPRGTAGELCTRGYNVMRGYWGEPERTREVLDEAGWMHTGDLAVLDEQGYCNIVGRVKDLIIRGGENISPREIEEHLYRHPCVLDVAVVGVPDAKYGEEVCACVRLKAGAQVSEEELRAFCRGQIAHFKVPRYVRFVDSFPLTVTGKVQKFLIRERLRRELGVDEAAHA
jgi:fatty-acyl-CoA synthase